MKGKQTNFKNPFDLIEEEEQPMNISSNRQRYVPPSSNVHTPLPFNPYDISKEQPAKPSKPVSKQPVVFQPNTSENPTAQFSNPFGTDEKDEITHAPTNNYQAEQKPPKEYELDENGDPPLLEDIGIEPEKIKERILLVMKFGEPTYDIIHDPDLSGPIVIGLALGCLLLFAGKIHFGDIYAMFILGNMLVYFLLNFISQKEIVPLYSIMSTMGYGLLPMLPLGLVGVFVSLKGGIGVGIALACAVWSSFAAGNFMDVLIKDAKDKKTLVIYPLFLFYVSFTMIVIF